MPKLSFSYIFDEEIERVFQAFIHVSASLRISFRNSLSELIFFEGNSFADENCQFSFKWKNYYTFKMISEKIIKTKFFKSFTHTSISIDKVPIQIKITFEFYWDSINEKTILLIILRYEDEFFDDLVRQEFTEKDQINICKIFEDFLKKSYKTADSGISYLLNSKLESMLNYILYPKLFFQLISKNQIQILNEQQVDLDEKYELLGRDDKTNKLVPLTILSVENLIVSSYYTRITYNTLKNMLLPNIKLTFTFKELANKKCMLLFNMKPNELITFDIKCKVFKYWKKKMKEFWSFFEKK